MTNLWSDRSRSTTPNLTQTSLHPCIPRSSFMMGSQVGLRFEITYLKVLVFEELFFVDSVSKHIHNDNGSQRNRSDT